MSHQIGHKGSHWIIVSRFLLVAAAKFGYTVRWQNDSRRDWDGTVGLQGIRILRLLLRLQLLLLLRKVMRHGGGGGCGIVPVIRPFSQQCRTADAHAAVPNVMVVAVDPVASVGLRRLDGVDGQGWCRVRSGQGSRCDSRHSCCCYSRRRTSIHTTPQTMLWFGLVA
jgi:hypothetical protein